MWMAFTSPIDGIATIGDGAEEGLETVEDERIRQFSRGSTLRRSIAYW